jgi:hypothetical protein
VTGADWLTAAGSAERLPGTGFGRPDGAAIGIASRITPTLSGAAVKLSILAPSSIHRFTRPIVSSARGLPGGICGFISPVRYFRRMLSALLPGTTAGPWRPPANSFAGDSMLNPPGAAAPR